MTSLSDFLTGSTITTIATVVLAITTIVYAWHTYVVAKENRLLRKAGTEPDVLAYPAHNPNYFVALDFVVQNVGSGPALNVSFSIISGGTDFAHHKLRLPHEKSVFTVLPQGEKIVCAMGMGFDLLAAPALQPFTVQLKFSNLAGESRERECVIDIGPFSGLYRIGTPPDQEIAESAKRIVKILERWNK